MVQSVTVTGLAGVGEVFRQARESAGRTQEDVARAVGLPQPKVSLVERGKYGLSGRMLITLAAELGLEVRLTDQSPQLEAVS